MKRMVGWIWVWVVACQGHFPKDPVSVEPAQEIVSFVEEVALTEHRALVQLVEFSPDTRYVASSGTWFTEFPHRTGQVRLWRVGAWQGVAALLEPAWGIAFSPDGRYLATCSPEGVRIWTIETWQNLATFGGGPICDGVLFSPDRRYLASWHEGGLLRIWQVDTWTPVRDIPAYSFYVRSVAFSPDAQWMALSGDVGGVHVWHVSTWQNPLNLYTRLGAKVGFSPDGRYLAAGESYLDTLSIRVWRVNSWEPVTTIEKSEYLYDLEFSPDGKYVAVTGEKGIYLWRTGTWTEVTGLPQETHELSLGSSPLAFSPDGRFLAVGAGTELTIWRFVALGLGMAAGFPGCPLSFPSPVGTRPPGRCAHETLRYTL